MDRLNALLCGIAFFAFVLLAGCPKPTPTAQPGTGTSGPQAGQPGSKDQSKSSDLGTGKGSLADRQAGKDTGTPASSPLKEVYFAFDSFDLNAAARTTLKANADWLKANPSVRVEVEGHCDERGTNEYNLALGAKRAQAAKDYLVTLGIPVERLSTISYGEELAVCKQQSEDCWQKNRRDRFVVTTARAPS